ncbi:restriction endonuclease subunit S [Lacibacter sp. MH-610]|uniref:restriction endonuclease subunit S n=1 Tax=Lacibacter sp. MH-610 TaxID=3020883 RepID=UPI003892A4A7
MRSYKVRDLLRIRNGKDHKALKPGKIPVYGSGGLMRYVDKYLYDQESILLPRKGTLSNIQWVNEPFWTVDTIYYTEINTTLVDGYYLFCYLINLDLSKLNSGTGVPSMTFEAYYDIEVKLPELSIQKKVSNYLKSIKEKIELNNHINSELEAMAKTIYDYWFVQFDFPDKNGKPYKSSGGKMVWNEELKREVPEGWDDGELKDIANITMGQSPPGESYNENGIGEVFYQGCTDFGLRFPSVRQFTTEPSRFAKKGDILLSVRAPVGTMNIALNKCCIGRGLAALNSKNKCTPYLYEVLKNLKQVFDRRNTDGTTFGAITKDDLFSLKVVIPTVEILNSFSEILNPVFEKQNIIALENQQLASLRDWLLPMLMNGQVKVGKNSTAKAYAQTQDEELSMAAEDGAEYKTKKKS